MPKRKSLDDLESNWLYQAAQGAIGPGDVQPATRGMANAVGGILSNLATLPKRFVEAGTEPYREGTYNPGPVLETAMMGPAASAPFALRGAADPNMLSTLYLRKRAAEVQPRKGTSYDLIDEKGKRTGYIQVSHPNPETVHVENIGAYATKSSPLRRDSLARRSNDDSQAIGLKDIRSLLMGIRDEFPEATKITGYRVSGARNAVDMAKGSVDLRNNNVDRLVGVYQQRMREAGVDPLSMPTTNAEMRIPKFSEMQMGQYRAGRPETNPLSGLAPAPSAQREHRAWQAQPTVSGYSVGPRVGNPAFDQPGTWPPYTPGPIGGAQPARDMRMRQQSDAVSEAIQRVRREEEAQRALEEIARAMRLPPRD